MINIPLNFAPPTGQVQNTYAAPTRTNQYLTSSKYDGMQLHTPSGLFYQGGKIYEPYTPPKQSGFPGLLGALFYGMSPLQSQFSPFGMPVTNNKNAAKEDIIKVGDQSFKAFTGSAPGIVNGNLSMVSMLNQQPTYQPQGIPNNLLNFLSAPSMQPTNNQQSSGAGRFLGLLGSPITTNTQGK
jgi:hypothetical protein